MFFNFPLYVKLIPYSGVDLTPFRSKLVEEGILKPKHNDPVSHYMQLGKGIGWASD